MPAKTSITRYLLEKYPAKLAFSVSAATRSPRSYEKRRRGLLLSASLEASGEKILPNEFAEWEMVYEGKYYGTLKSELDRIWAPGKPPLLDIEVKGAIHIRELLSAFHACPFYRAPSVDELRRRLEMRGTETVESLMARVNKASYEISFKHHFDRIIVNDDLQKACQEAETAIRQVVGFNYPRPPAAQ